MTKRRRLRARSAMGWGGLAVWAVGLAASPGHAQSVGKAAAAAVQGLWYQAYDQGVRAANAGNWTLAIPALEAAKRGGPAPGRRVLFQGDRVDVFNPDYYLGVAYNATRRFAEAEAAFARVTEAGLVRQGDREFEELRKQTARATYERTIQDGDRALSAGRYADAEKALQAVVGTLADDGRAGKLVKRAQEALATTTVAQQTPPATTPTPDPRAVIPDVRQTVPDTTVATNAPRPNEPAPPAYAPPTPTTTPTVPATRNTGPVTKAPVPPRTVPTKPFGKVPNPIETSTVDLNASAATAPINEARAEFEGMTAYHAGDYDGAIRLLRPIFDMDPPAQRVAFYLACSYVARAVLGGAADQATLAEARQMFTYAAGDSGQFAADRAFISPVVLRLLGSTAPRTERRAATAS